MRGSRLIEDHIAILEPALLNHSGAQKPVTRISGRASIDVVIPARNEASTIGNVVQAFRHHPQVRQVIVVDNGSEDETAFRADRAGAQVVTERLPGKGRALARGVELVTADYAFLVDGDIENPSADWITLLIDRAESSRKGVVRADPPYNPTIMGAVQPLLEEFFPGAAHLQQPIGGVVLIRRDCLEGLEWYSGWGVDIGLTLQILARGVGYDEVPIGRLKHASRPRSRDRVVLREIVQTILTEHTRQGKQVRVPIHHADEPPTPPTRTTESRPSGEKG